MEGKSIIVSAPSGAGKTTIVHHLLQQNLGLEFSISACSRDPRGEEQDGKDYYFLGVEGFRKKIDEGAFLEWEEVYPNQYYGTLRAEIERIWAAGHHVIFDVDVVGGLRLKEEFGDRALAVFIMPPNVEALKNRLTSRRTESPEKLAMRLEKAGQELARSPEFDRTIVNDQLEVACQEAVDAIGQFLNS